jgi:hypothetical protein
MRLLVDLLFQLGPLRALDIEYRISSKNTLELLLSTSFCICSLCVWNIFSQVCILCCVILLPQQMKFGTGLLRDLHESKMLGTFRQTEVFLTCISWIFIPCFLIL